MNKTNRSNFTSLSFTVEEDLMSQSSHSTYISDHKFAKNPFSRNLEIRGLDRNINFTIQSASNNKEHQQILDKAHRQAYKQLNNDLYNPFQHKLQNVFMPKEQNLYEKQKQRQIQYLKKKQEEELNSNKNYTILFNNKDKKSLKLTASNVLNQQNFSIQDYYNKNIMKKKHINSITQDDTENANQQESKKYNQKQFINQGNYYRKQNNKFEQNTNLLSKNTQQNQHNIKNQNQVYISSSNKQIPIQRKTQKKIAATQKPKTSKQIKKPANNYITTKPQLNPKVPSLKNNKKNIQNLTNLPPSKTNHNAKAKKKYSEVYEGPDKNLVEQIQTQIAQTTNMTFQEIAQLQNAKNLLQEAILLPKIMPEFFKGIRKAMKGILMFGPPGTGKTLLAKAVANENMFFNVSASSLASKWKGESQKMVRILFQMARYHSPSIIFFDQIDAIASKRSQNEHESSRKVKTQLLVQMDGVQSSQNQVFVLAATNRPWDLDEALRRRLQKRIYIPLPEKVGRKKMFEINLKQVKLNQKINWDRIVNQTNGYSGADISNVCRDAAYMPMRRMLAKVGINKIAQINEQQLLNQQLSQKDLLEAIKNNKPSVNLDDLKKYEKWMKQFGSQ